MSDNAEQPPTAPPAVDDAPSPVRIVSLLPSATELIAVVLQHVTPRGAAILVGRSHECDWPPHLVNDLPMLTSSKIKFTTSSDVDRQVREQLDTGVGLYAVDDAKLRELKPDVIVTQSLCKVCSVDYCLVESIASKLNPRPKVIDTNPSSLKDVLQDVVNIANAIGFPAAGKAAVAALQRRIDAATSLAAELKSPNSNGPSIGFLEWTDPMFVGGSWTPEIIEMAGATHPLNPCTGPGKGAGKSHTATHEQFIAIDPDYIIIAPCGLDLAATRREMTPLTSQPWWPDMRAVKEGRTYVVDGNQMFNRPGPRLVDCLEWLVALAHNRPEIAPKDFPVEPL